MSESEKDAIFRQIDETGTVRRGDPGFGELEKELVRSHALSLAISARKPTDPEYKGLLEELLGREIDGSVAIVSPFYCDCGCRLRVGKNVIVNKGATIFPAGGVEIADNVLIGPDVKIVTVNHDLRDRRDCLRFGKVTVEENAVVAAGAVVTKDVPDDVMVGGNPARIVKRLDGGEAP